ncbi:HugZ family protein [Endozoicomonas elysicola]|uniref:Pyridoxamine 5-phosphate oxidase n=1 Tax=Endozoicomonas elysicola TaxID=305900 RepID=A0A081K881_9GAMM|nr:pyridoxamine 5'-phosphate oxidase family protein [Endozoicomonas elysicola]KEI70357.1 pyridoxamine 5-phosphate oxidase [Endozoicomonas elysicola]
MSKKVAVIEGEELVAIAESCQKLVNSHKTLTLSTLSPDGKPEISYTPYLRGEDGTFYIFISELAHHTPNLQANPLCSILFAAPESETKNLFARERVFFHCQAEELPRGTERCDHWLDLIQEKFGNTVEVLRNLPDFHLFALKPQNGQYTVGFGKAFKINADGSFSHIVIDKKK